MGKSVETISPRWDLAELRTPVPWARLWAPGIGNRIPGPGPRAPSPVPGLGPGSRPWDPAPGPSLATGLAPASGPRLRAPAPGPERGVDQVMESEGARAT